MHVGLVDNKMNQLIVDVTITGSVDGWGGRFRKGPEYHAENSRKTSRTCGTERGTRLCWRLCHFHVDVRCSKSREMQRRHCWELSRMENGGDVSRLSTLVSRRGAEGVFMSKDAVRGRQGTRRDRCQHRAAT